ncbi:MAG: o-succinylbenzoate--CoA ligase [Ignavibacteria bacterium]|nr:o-succinylbenzoate--CoA ligase [Ignavibacteria bacterium]
MKSKSINSFFNFSNRIDLTAIIKSDITISYKELFAKANQFSTKFSEYGIKKNNYVPLLVEDQLKFIETIIAIWKLGAIPVPVNTKLLYDEISSTLDDYDFKFLVTDSLHELRVSFESLSLGGETKNNSVSHKDTKTPSITKINLLNSNSCLSSVDGKELSINLNKNRIAIIDLNKIITTHIEVATFSAPAIKDEAVVIFTSGSTGRPKGVVHTFSSLINSIENGNQILNHKENDRWLASLPFYHIGGFQIICRSLYYGCSIAIPESLQTNHLAEAIITHKPTHLSLVSTQLERLIHQKVKPDELLKASLIGGGFVDDELMFEADELGWKPFRVYGSSETASFVTAISSAEIRLKPQSVGKPFNDVEINITDESEILIKSKSLFKKYLADEKETSSKLINSFYHTGDLGFIDNNGYLFIEARRNDLIVTGGENVNPIEVEKVLLQFPFISDACVFPKQSKTWGQIIVCAIAVEDVSVNEKMIKENLKQKLVGYKIPKKFFFVDELPRTSLGKLEREKIRKMF